MKDLEQGLLSPQEEGSTPWFIKYKLLFRLLWEIETILFILQTGFLIKSLIEVFSSSLGTAYSWL